MEVTKRQDGVGRLPGGGSRVHKSVGSGIGLKEFRVPSGSGGFK